MNHDYSPVMFYGGPAEYIVSGGGSLAMSLARGGPTRTVTVPLINYHLVLHSSVGTCVQTVAYDFPVQLV